MKRFCFSFILLTSAGMATGGESLSPETLQAIKAATVYIKIEVGSLQGSGSGFLIKLDGDTGYIVTNHHVAEPKIAVVPGKKTKKPGSIPSRPIVITPGGKVTLTAVFASGTKKEQALLAEVLASDAQRDLAILKVKGIKNPPAVLDISQPSKLVETMQVYGFGFPFGKSLAIGKGHPAITISKGAISSIRTNDQDEISKVQIDGALNPGNSGGPVVDAKGRLVGIVNSGIEGSGIAFAIPPRELSLMLQGRVGKSSLAQKKKDKDLVDVDISVQLVDPFGKLRGVWVHYLPKKDVKAGKDRLDGVTGAKKLDLKIDKQAAVGSFQVADTAKDALLWQISYTNGEGKTIFTKPQEYAFATTTPPVPVTRVPKKGDTVASGQIAKTFKGNMFTFLQDRVKENRLADVDVTGFKLSKDAYRHVLDEGGILIGFDVGLRVVLKKDVIGSLRPIYLTKDGEKKGDWQGTPSANPVTVKAKPGYAVAGLHIRTSVHIEGFSLSFMKLGTDRFQADENYTSAWIGNEKGGALKTIGGAGYFFVGICGHINNAGRPCSLGLVAVLLPKE